MNEMNTAANCHLLFSVKYGCLYLQITINQSLNSIVTEMLKQTKNNNNQWLRLSTKELWIEWIGIMWDKFKNE